MNIQLSRQEVRRKALRAAAGVALFSGSVGCGGEMPAHLLQPEDQPALPGSDQAIDEPTQRPPAPNSSGTVHSVDAGFAVHPTATAPLGEALVVDAGTVADAGEEHCTFPTEQEDWETYTRCCEMYNWDPNRGCLAWGPPAPPMMKKEVV